MLQNFETLACLKIAFLKIVLFLILVCNLQTASLLMQTSDKKFLVIPIVVPDMWVGGDATPKMPLTVNGIYLFRQLMVSGRGAGNTPPKISGITIGITAKFLTDIGVFKESKN